MRKNSRQAADPEWKQLLHLGERLVEQPTPAAQCDLLIDMLGRLFEAQVDIWLVRPAYPLPGQLIQETLPEAPASPLAHRALAERKPQTNLVLDGAGPQDAADEAPNGPLSPTKQPHSKTKAARPWVLAIPMLANQYLLAVVQVARPADNPFSEREVSLIEGLVTHAALAMELTRQEAIKNRRYGQLSLVRQVSAQIASLTNLSMLYSRVTQLIQQTFGFYYVGMFVLEEQQDMLRFQGSASQATASGIQPGFEVRVGDGIVGTVAQSGAEIVALDVLQDSRYRFVDTLPETRSEAALPLKIENRILGVLDIQSDRPNAFHEADMLTLRALADTIALSIESTRLYDHLERRVEQISSVFEVSHALTSILDLDALLDEVVRLIQVRFGYPFVHVYTVHPGRRLVIYHTGTGERSQAMKDFGNHYALDDQQGLIAWTARTGRTFVCNDISQEPLYRPADVPPYDTQAEMTIPLAVGGEVLGVLDIQSRQVDAFDDNDRSLFEALAAPIAVAMRNANLYRSEQWRRRVAESFRDVAHLISTNTPLPQLLNFILEKLESILPCDASAIWLIQESSTQNEKSHPSRLRLAATRNLDADTMFEALQSPSVQDMLDRAIASSDPLIRHPDDPHGPLGAALGFNANYSSIAAPMRTNQRVLGLLTLAHAQDGRYGSESQAVTATFASYAAVAIQNARLYAESQEQALVSTMLLQVAEASQSIMTIDDLLATMIRLTRLLMGVKTCAFLLWDEGLQTFELKAWYGFEPAGQAPWVFSPRLPALARLMSERATVYLEDPAIEVNLPQISLYPDSGMIMMLPLLVRGQVTGAFIVGLQVVDVSETEAGFDPKALAILQGIAHQTAMTIDNLGLLEARQEEAYVTAALLQVAQAVVSSTDLNDTLDTIVHLLPILIGIKTCIIYLWDASRQVFRPTQVSAPSRKIEEPIRAHAYGPEQHNLLDAVRQSGQMHLCRLSDPEQPYDEWPMLDCQTHEHLLETPIPPHGDWVLGFPLLLQGQVLGVLLVHESDASPAFWERRLEILHGIAQQTSLAIQNDLLKQEMVETERMEREIQLARQIQETFLPNVMPQLSRWEVDLRWETARQVGGDFYDIFRLPENRLGLVIADVSDKGLPAALYMTVARTLIRASASEHSSPAAVLEEVNRLLVSDSVESMFITAVYAIVSLDTGDLVYCNAGHNRPLLYRLRTGLVEQMPKGGTALGILEDLKLENHLAQIHPGDSLILFTDGVTDIQSPDGQFFGDERLEELVRENGKTSIQTILEQLDDALIDFRRGTPPTDDVTLLAVRREPARKRASRAKAKVFPETTGE